LREDLAEEYCLASPKIPRAKALVGFLRYRAAQESGSNKIQATQVAYFSEDGGDITKKRGTFLSGSVTAQSSVLGVHVRICKIQTFISSTWRKMDSTPDNNSIRYRPEIDGLRALAVVPVLFYHYHLGIPGGFAGVDVFFVISGYLISSLLFKRMQAPPLNLVEFWERRIRRVFPALAVVTFSTLVVGWFLLLPADYKELGESVFAQTLLLSNVFFWRHIGYFDSVADIKPLLHTWSLAVEEQFYLLYPLVLVGATKLRRPVGAWTLLVLCIASFGLSVVGVAQHPQAAFYLLPSRIWELGLGALVATFAQATLYPHWIREAASAIGLAMILCAVFFYDASTPFPGIAALLPCIGAALFILSNGSRPTISAKFLSWRPFVLIGLISYSLYLWHWPILVFANYWALNPLGFSTRVGLLCLCFLLAVTTWKYVEVPCRKQGFIARRIAVFGLASATVSILIAIGIAISRLDGVSSRLPASVMRFANGRSDFNPEFNCELSLQDAEAGRFLALGSNRPEDPPHLLIWGDSHAMAALPALDYLCKQHSVRAFAATHSETPPLVDYLPDGGHSLKEDAPDFGRAVIRFVRTLQIRNVLLIARWKGYRAGSSPEFHVALTKTVTELKNCGAKVWIMPEVPNFSWDVPRALARAALFHMDPSELNLPLNAYFEQIADQEHEFVQAEGSNVMILNPAKYLSKRPIVPSSENGFPLYRDVHHLTIHGTMLIRPMFLPIFAP
jgi:peptidoglycan/LPS O-acetylase OafA/YrhL